MGWKSIFYGTERTLRLESLATDSLKKLIVGLWLVVLIFGAIQYKYSILSVQKNKGSVASEITQSDLVQGPGTIDLLTAAIGNIVSLKNSMCFSVALAVLGFLWKAFGKHIQNNPPGLIYWILSRVPWYRWLSVRKYKKCVRSDLKFVSMPFSKDIKMETIKQHVPTRFRNETKSKEFIFLDEFGKGGKFVVLGEPGAGKTMLLKSLTLKILDSEIGGHSGHLPVLVDLHRIEGDRFDIKTMVVDTFGRLGFDGAGTFVEASLRSGSIVLLLDGLDEVSENRRNRVSESILDLLVKYPEVTIIVTCRTAIYRNQFAGSFDTTIEIVVFDSMEIAQFLYNWPVEFPTDRSVESLLSALDDRPQILELAKNPLILSIIAFLYSETELQLPHSRTEFYEAATSILLNDWKEDKNNYSATVKDSVLKAFALCLHDGGYKTDLDLRSISINGALRSLNGVLEEYGFTLADGEMVLNEIVERSGLLLLIDGNTRYQFAHLSLQEFFAAKALIENPDALVERLRMSVEAWSEPVKLYCGFRVDSTECLKEVFEIDPLLAFECLGSAKNVELGVAEEIIDSAIAMLEEKDRHQDCIKPFGVLAGSPHKCGVVIYDALVDIVESSKSQSKRMFAVRALAKSSLPKAAKALSEYYDDERYIREALVTMDNMAVEELCLLVDSKRLEPIDDLAKIGTPLAAVKLAELMWDQRPLVATASALSLLGCMGNPGVKRSLAELSCAGKEVDGYYNWIWEPFKEMGDDIHPAIPGRIGFLIGQADHETVNRFYIGCDPRIVIPVLVAAANGPLPTSGDGRRVISPIEIPKKVLALKHTVETPETCRACKAVLDNCEGWEFWNRFIGVLGARLRCDFLSRFTNDQWPTLNHWRYLTGKKKYKYHFEKSSEVLLSAIALSACAVLAFTCSVMGLVTTGPLALLWLLSCIMVLSGCGFASGAISLYYPNMKPKDQVSPGVLWPFVVALACTSVAIDLGVPWATIKRHLLLLQISIMLSAFPFAVFSPKEVQLFGLHGFWYIVVLAGLAATAYLLLRHGKNKERESSNPLRGIVLK